MFFIIKSIISFLKIIFCCRLCDKRHDDDSVDIDIPDDGLELGHIIVNENNEIRNN